MDSQTLHEIYLQPFTDAVNAGVSSVMCSYNEINGYQACGNATTLTQILRNELGFKGFVTSDWGANHGTTYLNAGLDMEMPGGGGPAGISLPNYFSKDALKAAIASGSVQDVTRHAGGRTDPLRDGPLRPAHRPLQAYDHARDPRADERVVLRTARTQRLC